MRANEGQRYTCLSILQLIAAIIFFFLANRLFFFCLYTWKKDSRVHFRVQSKIFLIGNCQCLRRYNWMRCFKRGDSSSGFFPPLIWFRGFSFVRFFFWLRDLLTCREQRIALAPVYVHLLWRCISSERQKPLRSNQKECVSPVVYNGINGSRYKSAGACNICKRNSRKEKWRGEWKIAQRVRACVSAATVLASPVWGPLFSLFLSPVCVCVCVLCRVQQQKIKKKHRQRTGSIASAGPST